MHETRFWEFSVKTIYYIRNIWLFMQECHFILTQRYKVQMQGVSTSTWNGMRNMHCWLWPPTVRTEEDLWPYTMNWFVILINLNQILKRIPMESHMQTHGNLFKILCVPFHWNSFQVLVRVFPFLSLILCYSYFSTFLSTWSD